MPSEPLRGVVSTLLAGAHPVTIQAKGQSSKTKRPKNKDVSSFNKAFRMATSYSRLLSAARRGCKFNRSVSKQVHIFEFLCF